MNELDKESVRNSLAGVDAVITNSHVVYSSGKHGSAYVNKDAVYPHTTVTSLLCQIIAWEFKDWNVDVVIAPAIGGVILSQWTAFQLTGILNRDVFGVYADKDGDGFVIKRGYDKLISGKRVLVVEDVLTTGGSVKKVIEAVRNIGGLVVGLGVLCNRGGVTTADVGDPPRLVALMDVTFDAWNEEDCPLCKSGVPINTDVGKGREFLARKAHAQA